MTVVVIALDDDDYYYDNGVWYTEDKSGYTGVQAPVGGSVTTIPDKPKYEVTQVEEGQQ